MQEPLHANLLRPASGTSRLQDDTALIYAGVTVASLILPFAVLRSYGCTICVFMALLYLLVCSLHSVKLASGKLHSLLPKHALVWVGHHCLRLVWLSCILAEGWTYPQHHRSAILMHRASPQALLRSTMS